MGAGMTATLPPASLRVGAVGGIFVVSDETKRPDEAAMRRIFRAICGQPGGNHSSSGMAGRPEPEGVERAHLGSGGF